jgi:hypothetical protein
MMLRVHQFHVRHPVAAVALALVAVVVGGALLAFGLAILAGLVALGAVGSLGVAVWRRLTGRRAALDPWAGWRRGSRREVQAPPAPRLPPGP